MPNRIPDAPTPWAQPGPIPASEPKKTNAWGAAALALGVVAIVLACIPIMLASVLGLVLGFTTVVVGVVGLVVTELKKGTAVAGIILGGLSIIIVIFMFVWGFALIKDARDEVRDWLPSDLKLQEGWTITTLDDGSTAVEGRVYYYLETRFEGLVTITFDVVGTYSGEAGICTASTTSLEPYEIWEFVAPCAGYEEGMTIEFGRIYRS
ncbi:MAG: hypothetical protein FWD55_05545 [Propionibacteriaceae bacterium]|nr:hypothetical protein [Propionibacteriaceae bacterium]